MAMQMAALLAALLLSSAQAFSPSLPLVPPHSLLSNALKNLSGKSPSDSASGQGLKKAAVSGLRQGVAARPNCGMRATQGGVLTRALLSLTRALLSCALPHVPCSPNCIA